MADSHAHPKEKWLNDAIKSFPNNCSCIPEPVKDLLTEAIRAKILNVKLNMIEVPRTPEAENCRIEIDNYKALLRQIEEISCEE